MLHVWQRAYRWAMCELLKNKKADLRDLYLGTAALRNGWGDLMHHIKAWVTSVLVFGEAKWTQEQFNGWYDVCSVAMTCHGT